MCVSVCECGCCVCRAFIVFLRFSLCQECEESTEIAYVAICYEGATVSAVPVCVCVLSSCECTSVNPAVPTVTYLGHLLRGRAGTCLWNSTWGTDKRERLFSFILKDKHTWYSNTHALTRYDFNLSSHSQSSTRLRGFILSFAQMLISPLQSVRPASRHSDEYLWKSVCVCAFAFNYLSHWPL